MASSKRSRSDSFRRVTRSSGTDGLLCSRCKDGIPLVGKHVELRPCGCPVCHECLLEAHALRGSSALTCHVCDRQVEAHLLYDGRMAGKVVMYNTTEEVLNDETVKANHPRRFLWKEKGGVLKEATKVDEDAWIGVLYFAQWSKRAGESGVNQQVVAKTLSRVGKAKLSEADSEGLCEFFSMLNPFIVSPSITPRGKVPTFMPRELLNHHIIGFTPLVAALYGLATGMPGRDLAKLKDGERYPDFQSQYLAAIAASDIIIRCTTTHPGHFQLMLRDQLEMQKTTTVFRDLLSAFRLGPSREYSDRKHCQAVVDSLLRGVEVGPLDMHLLNGDNVGFTKLGKEASYDHWIAFQDILVRCTRLKQLKIQAEDTREQLSREPVHDWLQLVKEDTMEFELARKVVEVKDIDYERLTESTMESLTLAVEQELAGNFVAGREILRPGYIISEETRLELEARGNGKRGSMDEGTRDDDVDVDVVERQAPRTFTPRDDEGVNERGGETTYSGGLDHGLIPVDDGAPPDGNTTNDDAASNRRPASAFYGNDTTLNAVNVDLSKKQSTCMIFDYIWNVRKMIIRKWYDEYCRKNGHSPLDSLDTTELPPAVIGAFFMCDGQPAAQLSSLVAQDNQRFYSGKTDTGFPEHLFPSTPNKSNPSAFDKWFHAINSRSGFLGKAKGSSTGSRFYGKIMAFPGGFHAGMKFHNCCGLMFSNFLRVFFGAWRDTYPKVLWILFPSDPRQLEKELPHYILAHYRSAFLYLWATYNKSKDHIPTPAEVHEYMLERAKKSPFRQAVLLHLRYAEISKILRMAAKVGKRGSVEHFLTCIRLALPVWACSHAVDYVRLGCDFLTFMHCAPPAVKEFYANECFTRLTSTGASEYADDNMEDTVKHLRGHLGRVHRKGMQKKVENALRIIPNQPPQTHIKQDLRAGTTKAWSSRSRSHERLESKSPSIMGFDLIHDQIKMWHPMEEPIIGDYNKETPLRASEYGNELPLKETLNLKILKLNDIGSGLVVNYHQTYYIERPFSVERSEKDVPLTKLLATSVDREAELKKAIDRVTSLETDALDAAMNKDEAGKELEEVVFQLNLVPGRRNAVPSFSLNSMSKKLRIQRLIEFRRQYFEAAPEASATLEKAARDEFKTKYPDFSKESDLNVQTNMIYCLSKEVTDRERYQKVPAYAEE